MLPRLRIFLSSPTDVSWERLRAHLVIRRLAYEYRRYFVIEPFLWEYEPMLASQHFQDAVESPGSFDIVILTVWSRLGTPLPEKTAVREYRGIDGRAPVTGTEWEFEDALKANRAAGGKGNPDLLAYRRMGGGVAPLDDASKRAEAMRQYDALESFWRRWFQGDTGFLAGFATYREPEAFERRLEADLRTLIERRIRERHAGPAAAVWLKSSPFRGLRTYDFDDAQVFFGRHREIGDGLTRLLEAAERGTAFLLISGPSGSGKSSLARAGLLPSLLAAKTVAGVGLWRRAVMRPGDAGEDPLLALARALAPERRAQGEGLPELLGSHMSAVELGASLAAAGDPTFLFEKTLRELAAAERNRAGLLPHEQARLVLLIDQLEELTTRPEISLEQRNRFVQTVAALARSGVVWVIATVRSDLWHLLENVSELRDLAERGGRLTLAAPDAAQLLEMIRRPAQAAGLTFDVEPGSELSLDAVLAREAEVQPGVLPLLSVMLDELYERDAATGATSVLTVATYRALGGLRAAIGQRAESRLQEIQKTDPAAGTALPRVLRALVTVTAAGDAPVTRSAPLEAFADGSPERRLVDALIAPDTRLLTAEDRGQGPAVRLAHEALIGHWPRAKAIIAESSQLLRVRDEIDAQRRRWEAGERRPELLLAAGLPLDEARALTKKLGDELSPELLAFIKASHRRALAQWRLSAAAAAIVLLAAASWVWWWDQNLRIKTRYCADYGERWMVPFCIGPLDAATQAARQSSYRFVMKGGRVQELAVVGGSGDLQRAADTYIHPDEAWDQGVALWQLEYLSGAAGTKARLATVVMKSRTGVTLRRLSYDYSDDPRQASVRFDGGFGLDDGQAGGGSRLGGAPDSTDEGEQSDRSTIRRHRLHFDASGQLVQRDFLRVTGDSTVPDALGSYGRAYDYDAIGQLAHIRNLDSQGHTLVDKWGNTAQAFSYDRRGDLVSAAWLDRDGHLQANEQNFVRISWTRDRVGNPVETRFHSKTGALIARNDLGYARIKGTYDARGNSTALRYFDASGRPVLSRDEGVAGEMSRYDQHGNEIEYAYVGLKGEPVIDKKNGVYRTTRQYDQRGNLLEVRYFGTDERPILSKGEGVARFTIRYDERGNELEESYFGIDNRPILSKKGYARQTASYKNGKVTEQAYFDEDGRPVAEKDLNGAARHTFQYDDRGNVVEVAYFGADGRPVAGKLGFSRMTVRYDERGNQVEMAVFGVDGKPAAMNNGIARITVGYDQRGNKTEEAHFGVDGRPLASRGDFARAKYRYDERGNRVEWAYFGVDGRPIANDDGIARTTYRFDLRGDELEEAYFSADGGPVAGKEGYARETYQYDERGNRVERAGFGVDGKPVANKDGVARTVVRYDERGNVGEETYFGADGRPVTRFGYARLKTQYDVRSNRIEVTMFGLDGKPAAMTSGVARLTFRYDERGNEVEAALFGADGRPVAIDGHARETYLYDERGNKIEWDYFGVDGRPAANSDGIARTTVRYDQRGNKVEEAYFGAGGAPTAGKDGVARSRFEYDVNDRLVAHSPMDSLGRPAVHEFLHHQKIRVAQIRYAYNSRGEAVDQAYFDERDARIPIEVEIQHVDPGSTAEQLGLSQGDRLLRYDGETVQSTAQIVAIAADATPGAHELTVRRGGAQKKLTVPAGKLEINLGDALATLQPSGRISGKVSRRGR